MAQEISSNLTIDLKKVISVLRRRIQLYVWIEGVSLAIFWLGITFWCCLAIDYLPVLAGFGEMPRSARAVALGLVMIGVIGILYRWILRRAFVPLHNRNMAVLLERQFPDFRDSLLTAVELGETVSGVEDPFDLVMLSTARDMATQQLNHVKVNHVFNFMPLGRSLLGAVLAIVSVGSLAAFSNAEFLLATNRLYGLSDQTWPRKTLIRVSDFTDGSIKVGRGSDLRLSVFADSQKYVPDVCTIFYRTSNGDRGRVNMRKIGKPVQGSQEFVYEGKPFQGILADVRFDVVGYDHRLRDLSIEVVDNPTIVETNLDCTFPSYLVDEQLSVFLPRIETLRPGTRLPIGTNIRVHTTANKLLKSVDILNTSSGFTEQMVFGKQEAEIATSSFSFGISCLTGTITYELTLHDSDNIANRQPFRITIGAIQDDAPEVDMELDGIGAAITAQARLPVVGKITDDNAVAEAWFELERGDNRSQRFPMPLNKGSTQEGVLDFDQYQDLKKEGWKLLPGDKVALKISAADRFDLERGPNVGSSDRFELDVVTPNDLLVLLEARELGLRRRLEQIVIELTSTRDSLLRVKSTDGLNDGGALGNEPEDRLETSNSKDQKNSQAIPVVQLATSNESFNRDHSLRVLIVQRATQNCERSAREVEGVSVMIDDIRDELINNRIDTEARKIRLKNEISDPLKAVIRDEYPLLIENLNLLESDLNDLTGRADAVNQVVVQIDDILVEINHVLEKMLELENFNELIDIVRSLIKDQQRITDQTKKERKKQLFGP